MADQPPKTFPHDLSDETLKAIMTAELDLLRGILDETRLDTDRVIEAMRLAQWAAFTLLMKRKRD